MSSPQAASGGHQLRVLDGQWSLRQKKGIRHRGGVCRGRGLNRKGRKLMAFRESDRPIVL